MKRLKAQSVVISILLLVFFINGCDRLDKENASRLEEKIDALQSQVNALQSKNNEMAQTKITIKPNPDDFETYAEYNEALVYWKLQNLTKTKITSKPNPDSFDTYAEYNGALVDWIVQNPTKTKITSKPNPDSFATYAEYNEALIYWIVQNPTPTKNAIDTLNSKVDAINASSDQIDRISTRLTSLENNSFDTVELDPAKKTYQAIDTVAGRFTIMLKNIEQIGDTAKVTIVVGNLTSVSFSGAKFRVSWSKRRPEDMTDNNAIVEWIKSNKTQVVEATELLRPGRWNQVILMLPATRADQVGYISLTMAVNMIQMPE